VPDQGALGAIMKLIFSIISIFIFTFPIFGDDKVELLKQYDLNYSSHIGSALLTVETTKIEIGKKFTIEIRFVTKGVGAYYYNPFFMLFVPLPAQLAIFDSNEKYIGDLIPRGGPSRRTISSSDWFFIPGDRYVGTPFNVMAGHAPGQLGNTPDNMLLAGKYYIQMIYYENFIYSNPETLESNPPKTKEEFIQEFYKNFNRKEIFRSNILEIEFIKNSKAPN
jgi:hypothetical protein